jgi:glycosyltransferase involved in cell wall biosynthesis
MKEVSRDKSVRRFVFISTCPEPWGGSEELWSGAASVLAERGHAVSVFKTVVDESHPRIQRLKALSCRVRDLERLRFPQNLINIFLPARYQLTPLRKQGLWVALRLKLRRPDLVIVSQGDNVDSLHFGHLCRKLQLPYVLISQKASDHFWPLDKARLNMREVFDSAAQCFFVSGHNQSLTEDQVGKELTNAALVRNPFLVSGAQPLPWPGNEEEGWRLACVARLRLLDKGQDILLRVLAQEKWKARNLHVTFYGQGVNREGLIGLAQRLGINNVRFAGQTEDVSGIWREHHALIMPSRSEGLPLALVEAMMCGRPAVVTNVGGNAEIVEDQVTGFIAAAAAVDALDAALEKAWEKRRGWHEMGRRAAIRIRELVPADPATEFADRLTEIAGALERVESGRRNRPGERRRGRMEEPGG